MTAEREDRVEIADTSRKPLRCDICLREFSHRRNLQIHINTVHKGEFQCETCLRSFSSADNLRVHLCPKCRCFLCEEVYWNTKSLELHQYKVHFREKKFIFCCYLCGMEFAREYDLQCHQESNHDKYQQYITDTAVRRIEEKYQCDICKLVIMGKESLQRHIASHLAHPEATKSLSCNLCHKTFSQQVYLNYHMKTHSGAFKCNVCLKNYSKAELLENHQCVGPPTRIFSCDQCGTEYAHKWTLLTHQKECHLSVATLYCCDLCEYEFEHKSKLRRHQCNHPENRQFERENYLADPRNQSIEAQDSVSIQAACADTDKKSYQCDDCKKKFATKEDLRRHIEKHLKILRWHLCPRRFECKHSFRYHRRKHKLLNL